MPYIVIQYDDVACAYWVSPKGYCYRQLENEKRPKRISEKSYMSAYEHYYNL